MNFKYLLLLAFTFAFVQSNFGQETEKEKVSDRLFMPSIQIGYINNHSDELSGGVFIQTSLEYQAPKGVFFRINFDDYDTQYELNNPQNPLGFQRGDVSFTELVGGVGYRKVFDKFNLFLMTQAGRRFYGVPLVDVVDNDLILEYDRRGITINRYTLGLEYKLEPKVFLNIELFASHTWDQVDYWADDHWASGITVGISTTLF